MISQSPAQGILLKRDFGDMKMYEIACECGNSDDVITLTVEVDDCGVAIHQYVKVKTAWWTTCDCGFLGAIWTRLKLTYSVWVKGYLEYESFTMLNQQSALNYAETIKTAISEVEAFKEASFKGKE